MPELMAKRHFECSGRLHTRMMRMCLLVQLAVIGFFDT